MFGSGPGSWQEGPSVWPYDQGQSHFNPGVWSNKHQAQRNPGTGVYPQAPPPSGLSEIVSNRSTHVNQSFGQITPPDEVGLTSISAKPQLLPQDQQPEDEDGRKLSREERARIAANTRHAKSKKSRKDSANEEVDEEAHSKDQNKGVLAQREKNRIAAAKCRAKKKAGNEERAAQHREQAARNNFLNREQRDLRNEKTRLQNLILAHRPGACDCHDIHQYNAMQAHKLVLEAEAQSGRPISSPSQDSVSSAQTVGSDMRLGRKMSTSRPVQFEGPILSPEQQTFNGGLSQAPTPEDMQTDFQVGQGGQQMPQEFADFLQGSPGGRAGFS